MTPFNIPVEIMITCMIPVEIMITFMTPVEIMITFMIPVEVMMPYDTGEVHGRPRAQAAQHRAKGKPSGGRPSLALLSRKHVFERPGAGGRPRQKRRDSHLGTICGSLVQVILHR